MHLTKRKALSEELFQKGSLYLSALTRVLFSFHNKRAHRLQKDLGRFHEKRKLLDPLRLSRQIMTEDGELDFLIFCADELIRHIEGRPAHMEIIESSAGKRHTIHFPAQAPTLPDYECFCTLEKEGSIPPVYYEVIDYIKRVSDRYNFPAWHAWSFER